MKTIFYKDKLNGSCYKVELFDNIPDSKVDECLDAIGYKDIEFITEDEFNSTYTDFMTLKLLDKSETIEIGRLTMEHIDITDVDVV